MLVNQDKILAEATPSLKWATEHTSPEYWPGRKLLGAQLQDLSLKLSDDNTVLGNELSADSRVATNPVSDDNDIVSSASVQDKSPDTMD